MNAHAALRSGRVDCLMMPRMGVPARGVPEDFEIAYGAEAGRVNRY